MAYSVRWVCDMCGFSATIENSQHEPDNWELESEDPLYTRTLVHDRQRHFCSRSCRTKWAAAIFDAFQEAQAAFVLALRARLIQARPSAVDALASLPDGGFGVTRRDFSPPYFKADDLPF